MAQVEGPSTRLRQAPGLHHLHAHQHLPGDRWSSIRSPEESGASRAAVRARHSGALVPLDAVASSSPRRPAHGEPHRPAAVGHALLQPGGGHALGPRSRRWSDRPRGAASHHHPSLQGTAEAFQASLGNLGWLLLLAVLVIYLVLGILYESFDPPAHDPFRPPLRRLRRAGHAVLFGPDLDVYAFVGVILLVGLVKKNGIMMVDFAVEAQRAGKTAARRSTKRAWCASGPS